MNPKNDKLPMRLGCFAVAVAMALSACGGGGGAGANGGAVIGASGGTTEVAALDVLKSSPTLNSKGTDSVTLTVVAKSASNGVLPNQSVTVTTTDRGASISPATAKTDTNGQATFTVRTSTPNNRSIPLVIQVGATSTQAAVDVVGTTLSINGPTAVVQGGTADYTVAVRDSAGAAVAGAPVEVKSDRGNPIAPAAPVTDANGQATFKVTAANAQSDTIRVSASGFSSSAALRVSPTNVIVSTSANAAGEVDVNATATVNVSMQVSGAAASNQVVRLTATRGTLGATTLPVVNGVASTTISSPSAGFATIQATADDGTSGTVRVEFVSRTPSKIAVQASPSIVGVNLPGSTQPQTSQVIATVRDANDNPVKGAIVNFGAIDPSNGTISPPSAITDSSGVASVVFTPGATATGNGGVRITGTVAGTSLASMANLTASRRELSISFGTGNEITKVDDVYNEVPFGIIVTDSANNPVSKVRVQASLSTVPAPNQAYKKGAWTWDGNLKQWVEFTAVDVVDNSVTPPVTRRVVVSQARPCVNEDVNQNLRLDAGEDGNANGQLDPRPSDAGTVYAETADSTTDDKGSLRLRVRYLRDRGNWVRVRLAVTATVVAGTESYGYTDFWLPVLAADLTNQQISPPGQPSPYGSDVSSCANSN